MSSLTASPGLTATPLSTSGGYTYYSPQEIRTAYGINQALLPNGQQATGAGQTIAIIDAYHDPNIQSDLATFDAAYGLQAPSSFRQVQMGGVTQVNTGWAGETALDVEWAHAVAPQANLLLVEAPSADYSDLLAAVRWAASQSGVVAVSMSWGGSEFYNETAYDGTFATPAGHVSGSALPGGVTFVASSGDQGAWYGPEWPAVSPNVLAVGGTSLNLTSQSTYASESAWSSSGGGYSRYEAEPSFQRSAQGTSRRTSPDVAYDANPYTGMVVFNSVGLQSGQTGWWISGGTSAGAPQWAGIVALADQARAAYGLGSLANGQVAVYNLPGSDFHDVTSGSNGYSAVTGYDLATGRGSPIVSRVVSDLSRVAGSAVLVGINASPSQAAARSQGIRFNLSAEQEGSASVHAAPATASPTWAAGLHAASTITTGANLVPPSATRADWALADAVLAEMGNRDLPVITANPSATPSSASAADQVFEGLGVTWGTDAKERGKILAHESDQAVTERLAHQMSLQGEELAESEGEG
jgi:subtilase family serine protease